MPPPLASPLIAGRLPWGLTPNLPWESAINVRHSGERTNTVKVMYEQYQSPVSQGSSTLTTAQVVQQQRMASAQRNLPQHAPASTFVPMARTPTIRTLVNPSTPGITAGPATAVPKPSMKLGVLIIPSTVSSIQAMDKQSSLLSCADSCRSVTRHAPAPGCAFHH